MATLVCDQTACGGMRCDVVSAAGRTYRMTARITAPSGFSLGRADWWTESQSGSGGTATFNVSDGSNFSFVPYFDFVKVATRTTLEINNVLNQNDPGWTSGTLTGVPTPNCVNRQTGAMTDYCVYLRTLVRDNSSLNWLNPADANSKIDITRNGNASPLLFDNINDSNTVYTKRYTSWSNGSNIFRSFYLGTDYWNPSNSSNVRFIVNKAACVSPSGMPAPTVSNVQASSVQLNWGNATAGTPNISYSVTYPGLASPIALTSSPQTISGLTPGTNYDFTVSASNSCGNFSQNVSFITAASCIASAYRIPINLDVTGSGNIGSRVTVCAKSVPSGAVAGCVNNVDESSNTSISPNASGDFSVYVLNSSLPSACSVTSSSQVTVNLTPSTPACSALASFTIDCGGGDGDFFQVFGGGAVAGEGGIENGNISLLDDDEEDRFISLDSPGSDESMAGVLTAKGVITPDNMISQQPEGTFGWNLTPYSVNKPAMERQSDYSSLKEIVWKNSGASPDEVCEEGTFGDYTFKCFNSAEDPGQLFGVENTEFLVIAPTNSGDVSINSQIIFNPGKKVIVFVDGKLTVRRNVLLGNGAGAVFVIKGNLEVDAGVTQLDGVYVFSGKFSDGGGNAILSGEGMLIGRGENGDFSNNGLTRNDGTNSNVAMEKFYFQGKYLDFFKNALARPIVNWSEVAP